MPAKAKPRSLPKDWNSFLEPAGDHAALLKKCKTQKVVFDTFSVHVVRIKVPLPSAPGSDSIGTNTFISRMRDTDYFQANSMFDAAFPFASQTQKDAEKAHWEKHYKVVTDNKVRGTWITGTEATTLAKEYHLEPYIEALKESSPGKPTDTLTPMKSRAEDKAGSVQSTPSVAPEAPAPRRSRRSVSPKKAAAPKPRAASKTGSTRGRKKKGSVVDDESVASNSSPAIPHVVPEEIIGKAEKAVGKAAKERKPILDTIKVGEDDTAELLAAAKAQVEAAKAEEEQAPPTTRVKRALEIDEDSPAQGVVVKRARVDELEREVWYDNRRGRALLGLAIGLGASVVLPYLI